LEERKQENLRQEEKERMGKTAASMRYFANYLDPKDRYTGTYYDPKMNEYLGTALGQAYDLAKKGAGEAEILTAISPLVNKANDYQQKAKMYSENKKQFLSAIKGQKGYNVENIARLLDQEMFEGKDIDKVDPTDMGAALNNIYSKHGSEITNDEALDEFISKLPTSKVTTDIVSYNARGGKQRNKAMVDMPNIFLQEEEGGQSVFVPKYDKATDFDRLVSNAGSARQAARLPYLYGSPLDLPPIAPLSPGRAFLRLRRHPHLGRRRREHAVEHGGQLECGHRSRRGR
jgi:hypothetical protein